MGFKIVNSDLKTALFDSAQELKDKVVSDSIGFMEEVNPLASSESYTVDYIPNGVQITVSVPDDESADKIKDIIDNNLQAVADKFMEGLSNSIRTESIVTESLL